KIDAFKPVTDQLFNQLYQYLSCSMCSRISALTFATYVPTRCMFKTSDDVKGAYVLEAGVIATTIVAPTLRHNGRIVKHLAMQGHQYGLVFLRCAKQPDRIASRMIDKIASIIKLYVLCVNERNFAFSFSGSNKNFKKLQIEALLFVVFAKTK